MATVVGDINPKTIESARHQFVERYGSALVLNTYLKIALVLVSLVALGLCMTAYCLHINEYRHHSLSNLRR